MKIRVLDVFKQPLRQLLVQMFLPKPISAKVLLHYIEEYAFEHLSRR
jgi:hypothetical protein